MLRCKHEFPYDYFLSLEYQGRFETIEIDEATFEEISLARRCLSGGLEMERKFDILLFNFRDFENALIHGKSLFTKYEAGDLRGSYELHRIFGARITNFLSSARMYIDHGKSDIKTCAMGQIEAMSELKKQFSIQYDSCRSYRLMEKIRNYSQHRNIPINNVSVNNMMSAVEVGKADDIDIFVKKEQLMNDRKFVKSVLIDFESNINIRIAIFEYMKCLHDVHLWYRGFTASYLKNSRELLLTKIQSYKDIEPQYIGTGLKAFHKNSDGDIAKINLDTKWDDIRIELVQASAENALIGKLL